MTARATVLLIEDDPAHAELIERALGESNVPHAVHHVSDAEAALEYLEGRRPDASEPRAVLLDLRLPRIGGLELLHRIRLNEAFRSTPVIVLSSSRAKRDIDMAYARGANSYLVKPVGFAELREQMTSFASYWLVHNQIE